MVQKNSILIILFLMFNFFKVNANSDLTINELVENPNPYDQMTITIQAEVIGEVLERGEYSWINVNDQTNAIGIWLPTEWTRQISTFGSYSNRGDIISITGTFYHANVEHDSEMMIEANSIKIIEKGYEITHDVSPYKFMFSIILLTIAILFSRRYYSYLRMIRNSKYTRTTS